MSAEPGGRGGGGPAGGAPAAPPGSDTYKGWLFKWTNYLKGYQRRWFVLSNGLLSYYRYRGRGAGQGPPGGGYGPRGLRCCTAKIASYCLVWAFFPLLKTNSGLILQSRGGPVGAAGPRDDGTPWISHPSLSPSVRSWCSSSGCYSCPNRSLPSKHPKPSSLSCVTCSCRTLPEPASPSCSGARGCGGRVAWGAVLGVLGLGSQPRPGLRSWGTAGSSSSCSRPCLAPGAV